MHSGKNEQSSEEIEVSIYNAARLLLADSQQTLMDQASSSTSVKKEKTLWQLFTNDGRFDSKLPPYQRLRAKSAAYHSTRHRSGLPREQRSSGKSPYTVVLLRLINSIALPSERNSFHQIDSLMQRVPHKVITIRCFNFENTHSILIDCCAPVQND